MSTEDPPTPQPKAASQAPGQPEPRSIHNAGPNDNLPGIKIMIRGPSGVEIPVYALCDSGAGFSMIEENLAAKLGYPLDNKQPIDFTVFGGQRCVDSCEVSLEVAPCEKRKTFYKVPRASTIPSLGLPARTFNAVQFKEKFNLKLLQPAKVEAKPSAVMTPNYLSAAGDGSHGK